jgi:hypothetical protein
MQMTRAKLSNPRGISLNFQLQFFMIASFAASYFISFAVPKPRQPSIFFAYVRGASDQFSLLGPSTRVAAVWLVGLIAFWTRKCVSNYFSWCQLQFSPAMSAYCVCSYDCRSGHHVSNSLILFRVINCQQRGDS